MAPTASTMRLPALLLFAPLLGCASSGSSYEIDDRPTAGPPVPVGINDVFVDAELDVESFVARFEGESREVARSRAAIVEELDIERGSTIADIGAGTGLFLEPFARAVGTTGLVYAVDISPRFVEFLDARARRAGLDERIETVLCTARSAELPDESVDLAFVCDTYHHFEHPADTLASLYDALRPGGELVVIEFERIPGVSRPWLLGHVRAGRATFLGEIRDAGFLLVDEPRIEGLVENYTLRFRKPG